MHPVEKRERKEPKERTFGLLPVMCSRLLVSNTEDDRGSLQAVFAELVERMMLDAYRYRTEAWQRMQEEEEARGGDGGILRLVPEAGEGFSGSTSRKGCC